MHPRAYGPQGARKSQWRGRLGGPLETRRSDARSALPALVRTRAAGPILAGLRMVEISALIAAPLAGPTLASLGADVIRVDPPGGGIDIGRWPLCKGRSLYWASLNQGKRSVTIDMR